MNNETLDRLRLPGAWVLLGALGVHMLAGLISVIINSSAQGYSFPLAMVANGGDFYGFTVTLLLAAAVALVLTSERTRPSSFPVILTSMVLVGVGLLFCLIALISGFIDIRPGEGGVAFAGFLGRAVQGAVLGFFGFYLIKIFNDPTVVPRAQPQQQVYNQQPFPPATGAQQSFAPTGYQTADPAAQQQAYGYDPSGQQAAYGQDLAAQQQAYGQDVAAQQQAYGTGAQQAYGYDPSGQQAAYGQDAAAQQQAAYGQSYDPSQYAPQPAADQQAQDAIANGWYQDPAAQAQAQQGQDAQAAPGVEPFFNSGENNGAEATDQSGGGYGAQYGSGAGYGSDQQGQGGTDGQQNWYGNDGQR